MKYTAGEFQTNRIYFEDSNIGKISFGHIKAINIEKGAVSCDVVDIYGNLHNRCGILGYGANEYNWSSFPLYPDMGVIFIPTGYNISSPIIIGSTFRPRNVSDDFKGFNNTDTQTINTKDHTTLSIQDYIAAVGNQNNNNYLQITPENGIVLETDNIVRVQLPEDGILRISSNRQIVDEPLNGQQFINVVTPFFQSLASITASQGDVLTKLETAIAKLQEEAVALAAAPLANGPANNPTNLQLSGFFTTLAGSFNTLLISYAAAVAELAATNFQYGTLEYQYPTDELKPEMEATINRKVKLPK